MARPKPTKYNAQQEKFVRMEARGESRADIFREVFGIDLATATESEIHSAECKMSRWRYWPCYEATWKDEVKRVLYGSTGPALRVLSKQLAGTEGLPWLQNKAANDLLQYGKGQIFGDEERTVNVQINGLPDIGSPDQDETDG